MRWRRRIFNSIWGGLGPTLFGPVGSAMLTARDREVCRLRYRDGDWVHRYRSGTTVRVLPGGPSPRRLDEIAWDIFLFDHVPQPGDTVVDVGAGVGEEVRLFSRLVGDSGRVVSIEANPRPFRCLARTIDLNRLSNVTALQCAVTAEPGPVFIENDLTATASNALTQDADGGVQVLGRTLDEIMAELGIGHIDLLKMNIEGAELPVLQASTGALARVRNLVVSCHDFKADRTGDEWFRTYASVIRLLTDAGFSIRTRRGDPRSYVSYYVYASRPEREPSISSRAASWQPELA